MWRSAALCLELVQRNVSDLVDPPSMAHNEMAVLSPEQARAFLEAVAGDCFEALYALAITTGMRQGEILGLQWSDVDLEHGTLQVRRTLYCAGREFFFTEPKTRKSRRTVLLTPYAIEVLKRHRVLQNEERLALGPSWLAGYDLVFPERWRSERQHYPGSRVRAPAQKRLAYHAFAFMTCGTRWQRCYLLNASTLRW